MRKLSVFYEHILQACEQSGKTIPEVLAFCRDQGISAVEMNYSLFASEKEVIAPMLSDAGRPEDWERWDMVWVLLSEPNVQGRINA